MMMRAAPMAAVVGCTPSYFNLKGGIDRVHPEARAILARSRLWGGGIEDFLKNIEAW